MPAPSEARPRYPASVHHRMRGPGRPSESASSASVCGIAGAARTVNVRVVQSPREQTIEPREMVKDGQSKMVKARPKDGQSKAKRWSKQGQKMVKCSKDGKSNGQKMVKWSKDDQGAVVQTGQQHYSSIRCMGNRPPGRSGLS